MTLFDRFRMWLIRQILTYSERYEIYRALQVRSRVYSHLSVTEINGHDEYQADAQFMYELSQQIKTEDWK